MAWVFTWKNPGPRLHYVMPEPHQLLNAKPCFLCGYNWTEQNLHCMHKKYTTSFIHFVKTRASPVVHCAGHTSRSMICIHSDVAAVSRVVCQECPGTDHRPAEDRRPRQPQQPAGPSGAAGQHRPQPRWAPGEDLSGSRPVWNESTAPAQGG